MIRKIGDVNKVSEHFVQLIRKSNCDGCNARFLRYSVLLTLGISILKRCVLLFECTMTEQVAETRLDFCLKP